MPSGGGPGCWRTGGGLGRGLPSARPLRKKVGKKDILKYVYISVYHYFAHLWYSCSENWAERVVSGRLPPAWPALEPTCQRQLLKTSLPVPVMTKIRTHLFALLGQKQVFLVAQAGQASGRRRENTYFPTFQESIPGLGAGSLGSPESKN